MRDRFRWWFYYNVIRRSEKFIPWVAQKLPKKVKYYVVIEGMVKVEPNGSPTAVTGMQMLDLWEKPRG